MKNKTGLILGKFYPPHKGHQYLVDFARKYPGITKLYVVVDRTPNETVPQALRVRWLQEMFPDVSVLPLGDMNWQSPEDAPSVEAFWQQWRTSLKNAVPGKIDYCFNSEQYGWRLAEELGARHIPVDRGRENFPISGTMVRDDPFAHWEYLPNEVRPYFTKKVAILGAEATGKSTLANRLAEYFNTVAVPEYARIYLESLAEKDQPRSTNYEDIELFADGQMASETSLTSKANRVLICDTEAITTSVWSNTLYGKVPSAVKEMANEVDYDLYLVANTDVPWVADTHRQWEDESRDGRRKAFEHRLKGELLARDKEFIEITGDDFEDRFIQARDAIIKHAFKGKTYADFGLKQPS